MLPGLGFRGVGIINSKQFKPNNLCNQSLCFGLN
jgi:hypothetical protein